MRMKDKGRNMGVSRKEMEVFSYLELEGKRFFNRDDIMQFFSSENEMNVYIHRMKKKGRIVKINADKYYILPVQARNGKWSEHPYIIIDEMCNAKGYCIGGKSAANYNGQSDHIPVEIEVFSRSRQGKKEVLGTEIRFRRVRKMPRCVKKTVMGHDFTILSKEESIKWK